MCKDFVSAKVPKVVLYKRSRPVEFRTRIGLAVFR